MPSVRNSAKNRPKTPNRERSARPARLARDAERSKYGKTTTQNAGSRTLGISCLA